MHVKREQEGRPVMTQLASLQVICHLPKVLRTYSRSTALQVTVCYVSPGLAAA